MHSLTIAAARRWLRTLGVSTTLAILMSDLSNLEKRSFEKLLGMASGYVLDFSNRTFDEFILDSVGKNIWDEKYNVGSGSKANRLRGFWATEANYTVGRLLSDLIAYATENGIPPGREPLVEACRRTTERLLQTTPVPELDAINPNSAEHDFEVLAKSVRDAIEKNQPESALDRLHTFVVKYLRVVCEGYGITAPREKPLHSLLGEYIKRLKEFGHVESEMTERILKSSISTLEAFNRVRNDQSFAHDNRILNYDESLLIFNHVTSIVRFIEALERKVAATRKQSATAIEDDDIPF